MKNAIQEEERLKALSSYSILDTLPEQDYDDINQIAAYICQTPIALITFLDSDRQWFKSAKGLTIRETARDVAFCDHAIRTPEQLLEVSDAKRDVRFAHNPLVTGDPHIVFYAGFPLVVDEGYALGTLCVIDHQARQLSSEQKDGLKALAQQVVSQLRLRRSQMQLQQAEQNLQRLNTELQEHNLFLHTVLHTCPAGLVLWRPLRQDGAIVDFQYVFTNSAKAAVAGLPAEQPHQGRLRAHSPAGGTSNLFERLVQVIETGQTQHYQQHGYHPDSGDEWADITLTPCGDGVLYTAQDITPLKKIEAKLQAYSQNLNQLVDERTAELHRLSTLQEAILRHAGMAILSTDADDRVQTVNPAAEKLLGYAAGTILGKPSSELWFCSDQSPDAPEPPEGVTTALDAPGQECLALTSTGAQVPVLLVRTALHDESGATTGHVSIATDISAHKQMEALLQESLQREQEINKLKSQFITTASHEFRTPLTTIQSSVDLIKLHLERPQDESLPAIQRHLAVVEKQINTFSSLLSDVLSISRIEAGRVQYSPQPTDLLALVRELLSSHYLTDKVQMTVSGQPRLVQLDARLMTHVLLNLVSNAVKFSASNPDLGITFSPRQLKITITDRGIGIPAADIDHLFTNFFRASNAVNVPGSGLGLVIARQYVELHGGQLSIASQEHRGTTCTVTLPL